MRYQKEAMKRYFLLRPNQRIPLYELMKIAAQYGTRIHELRKEGMNIVNHYEGTFNGQKRTSFEYLPPGELFGSACYAGRKDN